MRKLAAVLGICLLGLSIAVQAQPNGQPAPKERVHLQLATLEGLVNDLWFLGYQSIDIPTYGDEEMTRYLILDFRFDEAPRDEQVHASITQICYSILRNQTLIRDLASLGYDQVSVAFDDQSQYDCQ